MAEYDVVIVGSGAAGGWSAWALTQKGAKVLLLEAGPSNMVRTFESRATYDLPFHGFGNPEVNPGLTQAGESNENQWVSHKQVPYSTTKDAPYKWVRVRMTGGRTNYWSRMSFRLSDYEFKCKDWDGFGENWPVSYTEMAPFYDRVDPVFRVAGRTEGLKQLPDGKFVTELNPTRAYSPRAQKFIDALKKRGYPDTPTRSSQGLNGIASSANLLLPTAIETGNLTILSNSVAREVTTDKATGLANGVHFVDRHSGREMHAKGRYVILGAGTLESTRLLLNSGLANSSGVLGHYLHDQFYIPNMIHAVAQDPGGAGSSAGYIPRITNLQKGEKLDFLRGLAFQWSIGGAPGADYFPGYGDEPAKAAAQYQGYRSLSGTGMGDVLARFENKVTINKAVTDQWGIPTLTIDCRYTDNEFKMADYYVNLMSEIAEEAGMKVLFQRREPNDPGASIHELGTCRMGDDPKKSVLNKWSQTHDIPNLLVVDGGAFVAAGPQNPTMTISALSLRAAEHLAEEVKKKNL